MITADDATPAASLANRSIVLDFADERSVVQTRFATSALALLRAHLGEDLSGPIEDARTALEAELPTGLDTYQRYVFLGHGWTVGIAEEAALKLREAAQLHTEAYPAMEYRHGPISLADGGALVWLMGSPDPHRRGRRRGDGRVGPDRVARSDGRARARPPVRGHARGRARARRGPPAEPDPLGRPFRTGGRLRRRRRTYVHALARGIHEAEGVQVDGVDEMGPGARGR